MNMPRFEKTIIIKKKFIIRSFLLGGASEISNAKYFSQIFFSKNNIDIFNLHAVRIKIITIYAMFN
jgi:hypothetical protein